MKKKKIIGTIAFFAILLLLMHMLTSFLTAGDIVTVANVKGFYKEPENSLDAVLIGPSEFYSGYSATMAWEEFGYTSYSLAVAGVPGSLYKSMTAEVLSRQNPKLIVFEINGFINKDSYYERSPQIHSWIDNIPWSKNKVDTISEVIPKDQQYEYYFKLATYHENWKDLGGCVADTAVQTSMNVRGFSYTKGMGTYTNNCEGEKPHKDGKIHFTEKSRDYLEDLLQYCQEMELENVLFVRFPHAKKIKNPEVLEEIEELITDYGYDFLNMNESYEEIGLDLEKDFYNSEHLNVYGMEKNTLYFGEYINEKYDLACEHPEEITERWDLCAEETGNLIQECKEEIGKGNRRRYFEFSIYVKPPKSN